MFPILGLHHVTATVGDAQSDLDFCLTLFGLRLVKKTVNFDNHNVYHFYYGNEVGTPGTIWTTFPYKGWGVRDGVKGAGQITTTSFSVPKDSLEFWTERLLSRKLDVTAAPDRFGEESVIVSDPSGLAIQLIANDRDDRPPWRHEANGIGDDNAIRGLHSVTLTVRDFNRTADFMHEWLGFGVVDRTPARLRVGVTGNTPGRLVDIVQSSDAPAAINGIGTVHHVAFAIEDPGKQLELRESLLSRGVQVTDVRDRQYFLSIYFREPGGVLFEVATTGPGFTVDEPKSNLGRALKLPPWEEPSRNEIESNLPEISY